MKINVVGTRKVDWVNNQGQRIAGTTIYALFKDNCPYVVGESVLHRKTGGDNSKSFTFPFVAESVLKDIPLGFYEIETDFNTGSICKMTPVK